MLSGSRCTARGQLIAASAAMILAFSPEANAELCRSTRHPRLILDTRVMLNGEAFADEALQQGLRLNNSYRSSEEQARLYGAWLARGRSGNPVARPGLSRHEFGFAFDFNGLQPLTFHQWNELLKTGERYGFTYILGDFPGEGNRKLDWPHFEANPRDYGITPAQALAQNRVRADTVQSCARTLNGARLDSAAAVAALSVKATLDSLNSRVTFLVAEIQNQSSSVLTSVVVRVEVGDSLEGVTCRRFVELLAGRGIQPAETRNVRAPLGYSPPCRGREDVAVWPHIVVRALP